MIRPNRAVNLSSCFAIGLLLVGCNSGPKAETRSLIEISDSVLAAIDHRDLPAIAAESAALNEQRHARFINSYPSDDCDQIELLYSQDISDGATWARQWYLAKSENLARAYIAKPTWFTNLTEATYGTCNDPSIVGFLRKARFTLSSLRHQINVSYPELAITMGRENKDRAATAERARDSRFRNCDLTGDEQQQVFNLFIRLEDRARMENAAYEASVGETMGLTPACVRKTMIDGLESGREPPSPGF